MSEEGRKEEEQELEEEELYPPARWLKRQFLRIAIKRTCEKLRELEPQEAIKFLEEELHIAERQQELAFWGLYYDAKYVRFIRRQIERVRKKLEEVEGGAEAWKKVRKK